MEQQPQEEVFRQIRQGEKVCDCPSCGEEIMWGLGQETLQLMNKVFAKQAQQVKPVETGSVCPKCGKGQMFRTNKVRAIEPPYGEFKCSVCRYSIEVELREQVKPVLRWVFVKDYYSENFDETDPIRKGSYLVEDDGKYNVYTQEHKRWGVSFYSIDKLIDKGYIKQVEPVSEEEIKLNI